MNPMTRVYVALLGLAVLLFVINMVRTRRLQERYALLWLLAGLALTIAPLFANQLDRLATAMGFDYAPALLLMLAVVGLLLLIFQLTLNITSQSEHLKVLTQEVALLRQEVQALTGTKDKAEVRLRLRPTRVEREAPARYPHRECPGRLHRAAGHPATGRAAGTGPGVGRWTLARLRLCCYLSVPHDWDVDAVDISPRALDLTRRNAELNGVTPRIYASNMFAAVLAPTM